MKLFAIFVGGEHPRANIEVHDIRFAVAASITDTYDQLRNEWWGKRGTLHLDCWAEVTHVDGFDIVLRPDPPTGPEKLFFVNLGGYDGQTFGERHDAVFVVATSIAEAKAKGLRTRKAWRDTHRDNLYEAEQAFALDSLFGSKLYVHLAPAPGRSGPRFTCRYTPLK